MTSLSQSVLDAMREDDERIECSDPFCGLIAAFLEEHGEES